MEAAVDVGAGVGGDAVVVVAAAAAAAKWKARQKKKEAAREAEGRRGAAGGAVDDAAGAVAAGGGGVGSVDDARLVGPCCTCSTTISQVGGRRLGVGWVVVGGDPDCWDYPI